MAIIASTQHRGPYEPSACVHDSGSVILTLCVEGATLYRHLTVDQARIFARDLAALLGLFAAEQPPADADECELDRAVAQAITNGTAGVRMVPLNTEPRP